MTYGEVEHTIGRGGGTKGILFWRWTAEDPTIVFGTADEAATLRVLLPSLHFILSKCSGSYTLGTISSAILVNVQLALLCTLVQASLPARGS